MLMRIFEWRQLLTEINNQQIECNQGGVLTTWTSNKMKYSAAAQSLYIVTVAKCGHADKTMK